MVDAGQQQLIVELCMATKSRNVEIFEHCFMEMIKQKRWQITHINTNTNTTVYRISYPPQGTQVEMQNVR